MSNMLHILQCLVPNQSLILLCEDEQALVSHVYTNLILSSVNSKMMHKLKKSFKISSLAIYCKETFDLYTYCMYLDTWSHLTFSQIKRLWEGTDPRSPDLNKPELLSHSQLSSFRLAIGREVAMPLTSLSAV